MWPRAAPRARARRPRAPARRESRDYSTILQPRSFLMQRHISLSQAPLPAALSWGCGMNATKCDIKVGARPFTASHSQFGEDKSLLSTVFCDQCLHDRTYLEIGALDGKLHSNTHMLEHHFGWSGLLIEGEPNNAKALIANRGKSGRNVIFNEAICPVTSVLNFTKHPGAGTAGVPEAMSPKYLASWGWRFRKGTMQVPCRPLSALMQLAGIRAIDFFSLDVEGAELQVLQTFDWGIPVKVFCIEKADTAERAAEVHGLLHAHGYVHTTAFTLGGGLNVVYIHGSLNASLSARMRHCHQHAAHRPCEQPEREQ